MTPTFLSSFRQFCEYYYYWLWRNENSQIYLVVCSFLCNFVGMKRMKREATRMDVGAKVLICSPILPPPNFFR